VKTATAAKILRALLESEADAAPKGDELLDGLQRAALLKALGVLEPAATDEEPEALERDPGDIAEDEAEEHYAFLENLADTAIKETKKNGIFVVPGLGRLVKAHRKARTGRNPQTGEPIQIKAKTVVKFRVAKAAKDAIAPKK